MSFLRKLFFYLFTAIFVVVAPILVLYSLGYLFAPGDNQGLVKTGLIYIDSMPREAKIYLGNKRFHRETPAEIHDLLPGEYHLSVYARGYQAWEKSITVNPGHATVLDKILLLPVAFQNDLLVNAPFKNLVPISGTSALILKKGRFVRDYFSYDLVKEKLRPLYQGSDPEISNARVLDYYVEPSSPYVLLFLEQDDGKRYHFFHLKDTKVVPLELTKYFASAPENVYWQPEEARYFFHYQEGIVNHIDSVSEKVMPEFLTRVLGFGVREKYGYALLDIGRFLRFSIKGSDQEDLLSDQQLFNQLFGKAKFVEIRVLPKDLILFLTDEGKLAGNRLPYEFVDKDVKGFEYFEKENKVLFWTEDKLGVVHFSHERDREIFERGPEVSWIYTNGKHIEQAFWVYEGSHILFRDGDRVFLTEVETSGERFLYPITQVRNRSSIDYSEKTGKLYYLDENDGNLIALSLLPREALMPLHLAGFEAEAANLLGQTKTTKQEPS